LKIFTELKEDLSENSEKRIILEMDYASLLDEYDSKGNLEKIE
jgi:hypothetical protein